MTEKPHWAQLSEDQLNQQKLATANAEKAALLIEQIEGKTSSQAWREILGELLTTREVQIKIGVKTRDGVYKRIGRNKLLALPTTKNRLLYPAFQFSETGQPFPQIPQILDIFKDTPISKYTIGSWLSTPQTLLKNHTPREWIKENQDITPMLESAKRAAARLSR